MSAPHSQPADSTTDPSAPLIDQLKASQHQMIGLTEATPGFSDVVAQHLRDELGKAFPSLPASVTARQVWVCRLQSTDEDAPEHAAMQTLSLDSLFWQVIAGRLNAREYFSELDNIDVVLDQSNAASTSPILNQRKVKEAIERLVSITPTEVDQWLAQALDSFWDEPIEARQGSSISHWLAEEFGSQLKAQADLHRLDGRLTQTMYKALTEGLLRAPDANARARLEEHRRPGVYGLSLAPQRWAFEVPLPGVLALTQHDNAVDPGGALLYRPGEPLQVYESLSELKASLKGDASPEDEVEAAPITESFLIRLVTDLRTLQKNAVSRVLLDGPAETEDITAWVSRLDAAANLRDRLDLAGVMDERELRLNLRQLDTWLHQNPDVVGPDRVAWWRATQAFQQIAIDTPPIPDPVELATPDALRARTRTLLAGFIRERYAPVDPEDVSLNIRRQLIDPHSPTGGSPFGSGISQGSVIGITDDRRSLTDWAMSNLTQQERNAAQPIVEGPLSFAQIIDVIERADIGTRLPTELQEAARPAQAQWTAVKARQMRAQVWAAHIGGDLRHDRDNTGLKLVLAALDSPAAAGREKVGGHEVVVRQLRWGDSVLKEILAFGVRSVASRPSLTLYTPGAPDGKVFRDVDASSARTLENTLAQALTATTPMTRWLISQLPLLEQARQLASLVPGAQNLTLEQKLKQVTQSVFTWTKDRAQEDFARNIASPIVETNLFNALYETQVSHAVKTAQMLTVSNAERDSTTAREGRRNGVMLLTGAMSMFPAGRLGGILGRAILPTMAGGAAVSAIEDEGGNLRQWAADFIGGLAEVIAEAGQDLIMARAGRRRNQARPALSSLPRIPDPDLAPFVLRGFDGHGLIPEGRHRYRDASGQGYLTLGKDYYKTAVQAGEQIIYAPDNRSNQRTVVWENDGWRVEERHRLRGGGALQSLLGGAPETPRQQTCNALLEGVLVLNRSPSPEALNTARDIFYSMPEALAERILRESMSDIGAVDINAYRAKIRALNQGQGNLSGHKVFHVKLLDKMNTWSIVVISSKDIEANVANIALSDTQKIKIYDTILSHQNMFFTEDRIKVNTTVITDNITGAVFMAFTSKGSRKKAAIDKIANDTRSMLDVVEARMTARAQELYPGDGPDDLAARQKYIDSEGYYNELIAELRQEKQRRHKPGLLTEIRNNRVPYIIANKGTRQRNVMLLTGEEITRFSSTLANYEPFDIDIVTQAQTHKVTGAQPQTALPVLPPAVATPDKFTVDTSPLAEAQMSYANFPEAAKTKVREIMEDIRAGRATTKRINRYYWYDMAQLAAGSGRSAWRAAFERKGDTWILQGFYDYHVNRSATVWEG
ncbi:dermonecrotic toxin domain-containing protein [Pseudomonas sp. SMN5]|uniref:dermonecrotic toxin domain-containing protein n=1 Tax=Pseudomonas sp. SMN5 TaxID=3390198 RepID=UPI003F82CD6F